MTEVTFSYTAAHMSEGKFFFFFFFFFLFVCLFVCLTLRLVFRINTVVPFLIDGIFLSFDTLNRKTERLRLNYQGCAARVFVGNRSDKNSSVVTSNKIRSADISNRKQCLTFYAGSDQPPHKSKFPFLRTVLSFDQILKYT